MTIGKYKDNAMMIGNAKVYQFATFLRETAQLYMDMALEPEIVQEIFDRMVQFELESYSRIMEDTDGQVDILRVYESHYVNIFVQSVKIYKDDVFNI